MLVADPTAAQGGKVIAASLDFAKGGGRTFLRRQHVPYPFHITRPHQRDAGHSSCATLILQSASGGLYRGDQLVLDLAAGTAARAVVRSQAATVVHAAPAPGVVLETRLRLASGALLALVTDPYILFPRATLSVSTTIALAPQSSAIVAEGFTTHDPAGKDDPFGQLATSFRVTDSDGTTLVDEISAIGGLAFLGRSSPLGFNRAIGTVMLIGTAAPSLDCAEVEGQLDRLGILGGTTMLPNGAGVCVRLLAPGGGPLARGLDAVVAAAAAVVFGSLIIGSVPGDAAVASPPRLRAH